MMRWWAGCPGADGFSAKRFRKLDGLATSIVLNIAEGNARFSDRDQSRFLETAHRPVIKLAAQLDICVCNAELASEGGAGAKPLLFRLAQMTAAMARTRAGYTG